MRLHVKSKQTLIKARKDKGNRAKLRLKHEKIRHSLEISIIINSRTAIAGAIIGLLLVFLFRRHDFCYDHMTSQPFFVHSFMQFQLNCMCDVIFRS